MFTNDVHCKTATISKKRVIVQLHKKVQLSKEE